jgi:hypothetical protein
MIAQCAERPGRRMMVGIHANRAVGARLEHAQDYNTKLVEMFIRRSRSNLARLSVTSGRPAGCRRRILDNGNSCVTFARLQPVTD